MDKVATVATRAMDSRVAMVVTRLTVVTKAMAMNKALTATASSKVTQGAVMEPTTDLTSLAPTMIRVMGSKVTTVATRAMDRKEATVETKAMANKTTMVATRAMNSLGMASIRAPNTNSLATARTKVPSTSKGLATPGNLRSNTIIITAENTRRTPATSLPS